MSKASSRFFFAITTLFVICFVWMSLAKVDITTQAVGIVVPEKNITKLGTMVTGEIVAVNYKQGDVVKKGDVIITINPGVGYEPRNIIANIDGRIQELTYRNPGSVVKQGDGLAILVPLDQKLIVNGRLLVKDRGYVTVGMEAKIISISPDAVQSDSAAWYDIELEIEKEFFTSGETTYNLVPGIHVYVFILTGERTVLSYITTPFHNGVGQALQER